MDMQELSVREIEKTDIHYIVDYWTNSDPEFMKSMGVDLTKIPTEDFVRDMLSEQLTQPYEQKNSYAIIWLYNGTPIGHCNINKIIFGEEAYMHLHIWQGSLRKKGAGFQLILRTLPYFFDNYRLNTLYCEPYALNPAPNSTLQKVGFSFEKEYITTPGYLNFEQPVKRWRLDRENYLQLNQSI